MPLDAADRARAGRRPASAGRRSGRIRAALRRPARRLRTGAPPRRRPARASRSPAIVEAAGGLAGRVGEYARCATSSSPTSTRTSRRSTRAWPTRGARGYDETLVLGDLVGYGADPNAVVDARPGAEAGGDRPRQPRQGRAAASNRPKASTPSRAPPRSGRSRRSTPENRAWLAALPQGPLRGRRPRRDLPRIAVRRRRLHLRRDRRAARAQGDCRGRSASSATPTTPSRSSWPAVNCTAIGPTAAAEAMPRAQDGRALPGQSRVRRSAARRRPARRLRDRRHRPRNASSCCGWTTRSKRRRRRSSRRGCLPCSRSGSAVGGRRV